MKTQSHSGIKTYKFDIFLLMTCNLLTDAKVANVTGITFPAIITLLLWVKIMKRIMSFLNFIDWPVQFNEYMELTKESVDDIN